ncbi:MAG: ABC transporter ATP-binding protein [Candidatus Auribacterota bacterium]|nr:ABC transporter ATP-binding protein [Candidatus Auribacterota bacterium]
MIKTEHLKKTFGDKVAVRNLDLKVPAGELFAFIGPNGAGKSTTIKMLVGLLIPSAGQAFIGEYNIQENPVKAKKLIGYIPDFPYLYEKLTGREFMRFVGQLYRLPSDRLEQSIDYHLDFFGLRNLSHDLIKNYSHGYRQRLVFASAFLHDPMVLIIDEPMVGLDPRTARLIKDILKERCREGATVFMSTHTLAVAEEIADRVGIIHEGELIACGSLEELRRESGVDGRLEEVFLRLTEER